jgi:hypothetical protein
MPRSMGGMAGKAAGKAATGRSVGSGLSRGRTASKPMKGGKAEVASKLGKYERGKAKVKKAARGGMKSMKGRGTTGYSGSY